MVDVTCYTWKYTFWLTHISAVAVVRHVVTRGYPCYLLRHLNRLAGVYANYYLNNIILYYTFLTRAVIINNTHNNINILYIYVGGYLDFAGGVVSL